MSSGAVRKHRGLMASCRADSGEIETVTNGAMIMVDRVSSDVLDCRLGDDGGGWCEAE